MKYRLIIPVLLLMAFPVRAQFSSMQADAAPTFPNAQEGSIVRVYNDQYVVGYIRDSSQGYFYAAEVSVPPIPITCLISSFPININCLY